jgi:hypothetical protein
LVLVKEYKQLTRNGEGQSQTGRHALEAMGKRCEVARASGNVRKRNMLRLSRPFDRARITPAP